MYQKLDTYGYGCENTLHSFEWMEGFVMPSKPCVSCQKWSPIFANKMCASCFVDSFAGRGLPSEQMPSHCAADGCDAYAVKKGLCDRHYRRFHDHGTTEKLRSVSKERRHPEYKRWLHLKTHGRLCDAWMNFWTYLEVVGDRPSPRHWLERPNSQSLFGPDNFEWRAPRLAETYDSTLEGRRGYQNALRANGHERYWVGDNLKRYYGITRAQYEELLATQGGVCALCDKNGDVSASGKPQLLAVDHDHASGEIRGLLCRDHNMMLGLSSDEAALLRHAADYLERPRHTGWFVPRAGDESIPRLRSAAKSAKGKMCSADGCDRAVKAQGLCTTHYARLKRTGSIDLTSRAVVACDVVGCGRRAAARGLCHKHYEYANRHGALPVSTPVCSVEDCDAKVVARNLCQTHYARWRRHGDANAVHDTHGRPLVPISKNFKET